jgi:hypothetical protein
MASLAESRKKKACVECRQQKVCNSAQWLEELKLTMNLNCRCDVKEVLVTD